MVTTPLLLKWKYYKYYAVQITSLFILKQKTSTMKVHYVIGTVVCPQLNTKPKSIVQGFLFVFNGYPTGKENRDNAVGIATSYGLEGRGVWVRVPVGQNFYFSMSSRMDHRDSYAMGTGSSFLEGKAAGA
jgi:hypothetical protein